MNEDDKPKCRSCGANILWAVTEKGKRMPLDPEPKIGGNIVLTDRGKFLSPIAVFVKVNESAPRYVSHFSTCPQAAQHRRKQ